MLDLNVKLLAEDAGFIFWGEESWGPGEGHIDWSSDYSVELKKLVELVVRECASISDSSFHNGSAGYTAILNHFGVKD